MKPRYIFIVIFFLYVLVFFYNNEKRFSEIEEEFKAKDINGKIIGLTEQTRGYCALVIKQFAKGDTVKCSLLLASFVEDAGISIGDSISKLPNSENVIFFKKENNKYEKCCEMEAF